MDSTDLTSPPIPENISEPTTPPQEELSEAQLREIYEAEEIERFLQLFSTVRTIHISYITNIHDACSMLRKSDFPMQRDHRNHK